MGAMSQTHHVAGKGDVQESGAGELRGEDVGHIEPLEEGPVGRVEEGAVAVEGAVLDRNGNLADVRPGRSGRSWGLGPRGAGSGACRLAPGVETSST